MILGLIWHALGGFHPKTHFIEVKSFFNRSFLTFFVFLPISITQSVYPELALPLLSPIITSWYLVPDQRLLLTRLLFLKAAAESPSFFHLWCADRTGSRARIDVCVDSLFLFWPCGWRKERMCLSLSLRPKRGSSANDAMKRFGWRSRNPFRARCHLGKPSRILQKSFVAKWRDIFHYCVHLYRAVSLITSLITFKINLFRTDDKVNEYRGTVTVQISYSCWAVGT